MKALAADDPRLIGEYRLRAQLGSGGMGRVYLGLSPGGRAVAIKVVNPDLAGNEEFLHRFAQEVAAARAVSGIYTAPVVASGLNERPPWLATAFVRARRWTRWSPSTGRCPRPRCGRCWPGWPRRWRPSTRAGWCTATSSPPTCYWPPTGRG